MDYIKIRFGEGFDFNRIGSEIERTIENVFQTINPIFTNAQRVWKPQMDMHETPDAVIILAEIAGVKKEDLDIEISSKAVKISGTRTEISLTDNARYQLAEIQYGTFERILILPVPIDPEIVSASYSNGFLQIHLARLPLNKIYRIRIEHEDI